MNHSFDAAGMAFALVWIICAVGFIGYVARAGLGAVWHAFIERRAQIARKRAQARARERERRLRIFLSKKDFRHGNCSPIAFRQSVKRY